MLTHAELVATYFFDQGSVCANVHGYRGDGDRQVYLVFDGRSGRSRGGDHFFTPLKRMPDRETVRNLFVAVGKLEA